MWAQPWPSCLHGSFIATPGADMEAIKTMMQREAFVTDKMEKAKSALRCSSLWVIENPSPLKPGAAGALGGCDLCSPHFPAELPALLSSPLPGAPQNPSLLPFSMPRDCRAPWS